MRTARRKEGQEIHTRIFYRDQSIYAQWKSTYQEEYTDIPEPDSAKIPGTEFWRRTEMPRLNNMKKGAPVHKPALDAKVPEGRKRTDEVKRGGRGRGGRGREGSSGPKGVEAGT